MEWNDIYDENRNLTGRVHRRGNQWKPGEYGVVVCVWVYDGAGHLLLTRRAKGKSFAGTWENSGGAVQAGETSRQAVARELEERGHEVEIITDTLNMGRGQIIRRLENGVLAGATEPRCDGTVAAW